MEIAACNGNGSLVGLKLYGEYAMGVFPGDYRKVCTDSSARDFKEAAYTAVLSSMVERPNQERDCDIKISFGCQEISAVS
jgi:hypothetical protein